MVRSTTMYLPMAIPVAAGLLLSACARPEAGGASGVKEPDRVVVQHILISFEGKLQGKPVQRQEPEARRLAYELLERARDGENFDALVREYTDDRHPGIYRMANGGIDPGGADEYRRSDMVAGFGDVAFALQPGGIDICEFDSRKSPFGYHIIKRLQ